MVKSRAEIQREYRRRLKEDPEKYELYLSQARQRKSKNYVPTERLSKAEKKKRSERNKEYLKRHRDKKRLEVLNRNIDAVPEPSSSGYDTGEQTLTPMIVNLPFPNRRNGPRKRMSKSLAKKTKELKQLKHNHELMKVKYRTSLRALQRFRKQAREGKEQKCAQTRKEKEILTTVAPESSDTASIDQDNLNRTEAEETNGDLAEHLNNQTSTPNTRTKKLMKEAKLSKRQEKQVRKQLTFGFVMQSQIAKQKHSLKRTQLGTLRRVLGNKILRKYRMKKMINRETGLGRNRMKKEKVGKVQRSRQVEIHRDMVIEFLSRDDNSRSNPGKRDKIKAKDGVKQTRTLTDYTKNLYEKFISENPNIKLSLTSFRRIRPSHIKLTAFISRSACLCTRHQNMALCVRALKNKGVDVPLNPEEFLNDEDARARLNTDLPNNITIGQWKRVPVEEKGRTKMVMKIVEQQMDRNELQEYINKQIEDFANHVRRVKKQYAEIRILKSSLKPDEAIVHMDFAENYACKTVEEVQSAYWSQTAVTIHPAVVYYINTSNQLAHKSIVIVSDELGHNASSVLTFLDHVIPRVKSMVPGLRRVHYWTDGPTSQYRNKTIFHTVSTHNAQYDVNASWNYFEAGHGKGPCDGLGGLTKRMADEAVRSGKTVIQDPKDFFAWTQSSACTITRVEFIFVPSEECQQKAKEIAKLTVKPIKGTMKMHAIVGKDNGALLTAEVSCYCDECRDEKFCNTNWSEHRLEANERRQVEETNEANSDKEPVTHHADIDENTLIENDKEPVTRHGDIDENTSIENDEVTEIVDGTVYALEDFVAAVYLNKWYVGQIIDTDEGEYEVTFMKTHKYQNFQWPTIEDKIWIGSDDILVRLNPPIPTGRSQRAFKFTDDELDIVKAEFAKKCGE